MKSLRTKQIFFLILVFLNAGCIEEYPPPVVNEEIDYLVVDGTIDSNSGTATVRLSNAIPLSSNELPPVELNAQVSVEDSDGNIYLLSPENDQYTIANIPIDLNLKYRVNIRRSNGKQYRSEFVPVKNTPEIDSVTWRVSSLRDGFDVLVNTHDDTGNSRYYQWTYEETYEYISVYNSEYKYENGEVVPTPPEESTRRCWQTLPSQRIIIGSSENLDKDIISNFPIQFVQAGSQKMIIKYSINVRQRALSQEAYQYWTNLKATTENLGGLFDPQPGSVTGNIYNIGDLSEPVLGYFDVGAYTESRLFIDARNIPGDLRSSLNSAGCNLDTVDVEDAHIVGELGLSYVSAIQPILEIIGYQYTIPYCTDCRLQGGTTTRPPFWE